VKRLLIKSEVTPIMHAKFIVVRMKHKAAAEIIIRERVPRKRLLLTTKHS
jgi:hypothetical protein